MPATTVAQDTFARSVSNGWGTADVGGTYQLQSGAASEFAVDGSVGTALVNTTTARAQDLPFTVRDSEQLVRVRVGATPTQNTTAGCRARAATDYYLLQGLFLTNAGVQARVRRNVSGTFTNLQVTSTGQTWAAGDWFWIRARVTGASPTQLQLRVWKDGTTEPTTWHADTTDSTASLQSAARIGLQAQPASAHADTTISFDDWSATDELARTTSFALTTSHALASSGAKGATSSFALGISHAMAAAARKGGTSAFTLTHSHALAFTTTAQKFLPGLMTLSDAAPSLSLSDAAPSLTISDGPR